tara:strand:+ start:1215 stop:1442 length:228 start_codon:yes stop_codon:yes gene_type:complete
MNEGVNMELQAQHENLILQIILNAIKDEGVEYLESDAGHNWMTILGINPQIAKDALALTDGKVKDIRYINERLDD